MAPALSWVFGGDRSCSPANGYPVVTRPDNWLILFRKSNTLGRSGPRGRSVRTAAAVKSPQASRRLAKLAASSAAVDGGRAWWVHLQFTRIAVRRLFSTKDRGYL